MLCPIDATPLVMTDRSGVEIDYCPRCRGVWLDRGELDKIIERSVGVPAPPPVPARPSRAAAEQDHEAYEERPRKRKKKEGLGGFLDDIFDF